MWRGELLCLLSVYEFVSKREISSKIEFCRKKNRDVSIETVRRGLVSGPVVGSEHV